MFHQSKSIYVLFIILVFSTKLIAKPKTTLSVFQIQIDSLIQKKTIDNELTQLDLLILYENALKEQTSDSINVFKNLAKINAHLEQLDDAYTYTEKYINNSLNFSILNDDSYEDIRDSSEFKKLESKYLPKINILTGLFFYIALIGIYFVIILNFSKRRNKNASIFISGFVLLYCLFILEFVFLHSNLQFKFPHTYKMSSIGALLYGPLLYFYFKTVIKRTSFKKIDLLHFLPALVMFIMFLPVYTLSSDEKIRIILGQNTLSEGYTYFIFFSKITSLIIYTFFIGELLKIDRGEDENKEIINWKKTVFRIQIAYLVSYTIYGICSIGKLGLVSLYVSYLMVGIMSIMVIYVAYMAYLQQDIFNNIHTVSLKEKLFSKYQKSSLTIGLTEELKSNLLSLFEDEKIYRENNLSLEILANRLNTTRHNTSQIINEHFKMNFFELVNMFRVKEVVDILKNDTYGSLNIIDVAYEVGYNNKVTFNKAFKKEMHLTPSQFLENIKNKS
ncbi:helix-turn-helix domain-containing protein [Yeosuana marina]|uniref:helix-turn-helix domain-containing protein n=1 Tax=Yeosuana marina TaxID=1565536 RepID=UPI00142014D0|nr:helix-turn-helix domain-containing protein [Yeosuana marina]|tara:strand:- start:54 stop:1562 length:1509 start_codon:yes stop_codon:yes gene_type:complete